MKFGSIMFGIVITGATLLAVKVAYEHGKAWTVDEIFKRGWVVMDPNGDDHKKK